MISYAWGVTFFGANNYSSCDPTLLLPDSGKGSHFKHKDKIVNRMILISLFLSIASIAFANAEPSSMSSFLGKVPSEFSKLDVSSLETPCK